MIGPPDVSAWPGVELGDPLTGGSRAPVFRAHRDGQLLVVKVSFRTPASLAWELEVLRTLDHVGLRVPVTVPTVDGRSSRDGVVVQTFLPGHPPRTPRDWTGVAAFITRVHDLTRSWPQRPGSLGIRQLLTQDRGGDVDLTAMPAPAAALVRACFGALLAQLDASPVAGTQRGGTCVIHGDLGAGAVLVHDGEIGVIDWDEARVDVPALDLVGIPGREGPPGVDLAVVQLAALAWETATCWVPEPRYASRLLNQLRDATAHQAPTTPPDHVAKTSQQALNHRSGGHLRSPDA